MADESKKKQRAHNNNMKFNFDENTTKKWVSECIHTRKMNERTEKITVQIAHFSNQMEFRAQHNECTEERIGM